jgi:S1-C subfamily serine protease
VAHFFVSFLLFLLPLHANVNEAQIKTTQQYIVSIKTRSVASAYSQDGTFFGTGCVIDKSAGLILTNAHVVGTDRVVPFYEITLHNGQEVKAFLLYTDPWHDFAFLVVPEAERKRLTAEMPVDNRPVKVGEPVYIIGKNENKHFSTQTGTIASPYETTDILPNQVFRISLNAQGGASGSPVCAADGKVIGLLHASNSVTSAFALPISYAVDALKYLKQNTTPPRFHVGVILDYQSLDDLARFYRLSTDFCEKFRAQFPTAFNRALVVSDILVGSPAEGVFQVGDIITHVNGSEVGPDLYAFDKTINLAAENDANLTFKVIRLGEEKTLTVKPYNLQKRTIQRLVQFGGAVFYEADDATIRRTGARHYPVFVTNVRSGSSFFEKLPMLPRSNVTLVAIHRIDDMEIKSLDDLIRAIPLLIKKEDFFMVYTNYAVDFGMDSMPLFSQTQRVQHISYSRHDGVPEVFTFDGTKKTWDVKSISMADSIALSAQPSAIQPKANWSAS